MRECISIRTYTPVDVTHSHEFHQIVVPLQGSIEICLGDETGSIAVGHCVIVQKNTKHTFKAKNNARFLVADLNSIPDSAENLDSPFATVSSSFRSFCVFSDIQLSSNLNVELEESMIAVFKHLLSQQDFLPQVDRRISMALEHIENDISAEHTLAKLATISSLSVSQFKVLFLRHTRKTVGQHILMLRMEKARALLVNTDLPIGVIAHSIGYSDQSAFTRRFQKYYGMPPSHYMSSSKY